MSAVMKNTECPRCGSGPGDPCRSSTGNELRITHASRLLTEEKATPPNPWRHITVPLLAEKPEFATGIKDEDMLRMLPERAAIRFPYSGNVGVKLSQDEDLWLLAGNQRTYSSAELADSHWGCDVIWLPENS